MILSGFLFLLLVTDGSPFFNYSEKLKNYQHDEGDWKSSNSDCTHRDVLKHLNMTQMNENAMIRPGKAGSPLRVDLDVLVYAILDVNEKEQKFVSYIWVDVMWRDEDFSWDSKEFCGIYRIYPPAKAIWKPDLTIEEMTEKNKALPTPFLMLSSYGGVVLRNHMVVVSNCKMRVYKFPFDVQNCNLSFKSIIHFDDDVQLDQLVDSTWTNYWSRRMMTQSEWLFINMSIHKEEVNSFGYMQSMLVYTITMKRRSALYIVNFLLPIMFFFGLDLTSFLISDGGGEKLGFKVTVLLAVTVMQLILNEILPSSSDRIPLIAVYCIGIFGLMMLSLLETILVMYLLEKDAKADEDQNLSEYGGDKHSKANLCNCCGELKKWTPSCCIYDVSVEETSEELSVAKEGSSSQQTEESDASEKVEPEEVEKPPTVFISRKEGGKPGYWTRVTKIINRVFFVSYVTAATLFLIFIFLMWIGAEDE